MPNIDLNATKVTQINHIKVEPKNQDALVQRMIQQIDEVAMKQPGFISSTIHKSRDGHAPFGEIQKSKVKSQN